MEEERWKEWGGVEEERGGWDGRKATHCGGQSALTATGVAKWDLSRLDRWTDRATPRWQTLALNASVSTQTHQRAHTNTLTHTSHYICMEKLQFDV